MRDIIGYGLCLLLIILGVKGSIASTNENGNIKYTLNRVLYYFSIFLSFIIVNFKLPQILAYIIKITSRYYAVTSLENQIFRVGLLIVIYLIINFTIYNVLKFIFLGIYRKKRRSYKSLMIHSTILGTVKGIIITIIMFIIVVIINNTLGNKFQINTFSNIKIYKNIESAIKRNLWDKNSDIRVNENEEVKATSNVLVYYNGVTLEDGIKSNNEINNKANELVRYKNKDIEKAKSLYVWIGSNIEYDFEKADKTLNNQGSNNSGAIEAWLTRKGICFDYACLYVAMAREIGLKVRLITGMAYDGVQYGPHAWNEVYLEDEKRWISVDPTFYLSGNYFDSEVFDKDHIKEEIAGEW